MHPVEDRLAAVSSGRLPPTDGVVEVHPQPSGPAAGVLAFTAHHVVAADIASDWVHAHLDADDIGAAMKPPFLSELAELLRRPAGALDVVLVATAQPGTPALDLVPLDRDHARLTRAHRYRTDIRAYSVAGVPQSMLLVGRGFAGRWEAAFEVPPDERNRGLGRALAQAARGLIPGNDALWLQASPGNAASLRAVLAAGFRPVGSEVLFVADTPR